MIGRLLHLYGEGPLHLMATVASLAFTAFILTRVAGEAAPLGWALWLVGAIALHDALLFPLTAGLDRIARASAGRTPGRAGPVGVSALNHLRVPAVVCGVLLLVWLPGILGVAADDYERATGLEREPLLGTWLALTAVAFGVSALAYALRVRARGGRE